ncbi:ETS-related transcription factor Elf-5-like [Neocloeon triangulifer]|uniref:ETS-related transcription factor Elf-5-like n=1 Tax=Neocloeon triangulifer TaxID=2078957 RepID=UPI00286F7445|nr:ETS-related transcription factor Elf-5-like [Neocloeon triangulifer]
MTNLSMDVDLENLISCSELQLENNKVVIWKFLLDLLNNAKFNPSSIKWEDENRGTFKIVDGLVVAREWKARRGKDFNRLCSKTAVDNFYRALRYHYKTGCLHQVQEKRVFRFGSKTKWLNYVNNSGKTDDQVNEYENWDNLIATIGLQGH